MTSFPLKIVTADGLIFDGNAEKVIVRTVTGDMAVLARHINCVCPLGMGQAVIESDGQRRTAACIGGMINVIDGAVMLVPTTFEWAEDIDLGRAQDAEKRAREELAASDKLSARELCIAEAKMKRALIRQNVHKGN